MKPKSPSRTNLALQVAHFLAEMHRYDAGRTLPLLHASALTTAQLAVLEFVRVPRTVSAVAEHLGLSRPATSQMVQKLVERELIRRSEGAIDRRQRNLELTPDGEALIGNVATARVARFEASLVTLPSPVAARLGSALAAANQALHRAAVSSRPPTGHRSETR